jgi:hypothetical protein
LLGESLAGFDYVDSSSLSSLIGYSQPLVGNSRIYKVQIYGQQNGKVTAFAVPPEPNTFGYAMLVLDTSKDLAMVEMSLYTAKGVLKDRMEVSEYRRVGDVWVPVSITSTQYADDDNGVKERSRTEIKYRDCEAPASIPDSIFDLRFPPGTPVRDLSQSISAPAADF